MPLCPDATSSCFIDCPQRTEIRTEIHRQAEARAHVARGRTCTTCKRRIGAGMSGQRRSLGDWHAALQLAPWRRHQNTGGGHDGLRPSLNTVRFCSSGERASRCSRGGTPCGRGVAGSVGGRAQHAQACGMWHTGLCARARATPFARKVGEPWRARHHELHRPKVGLNVARYDVVWHPADDPLCWTRWLRGQ